MGGSDPHLPRQVPIDAYGNGGFRFGGMSHRGAILILPDGIWAWDVAGPAGLTAAALAPALAAAGRMDLFLLGTGQDARPLPADLRELCRAAGLKLDLMNTPAAFRTYNVLLAEGRRIGAGLIAVG